MPIHDWMEFLLFSILLIALTPVLGDFMAKVFQGETTFLKPCLGWAEQLSYRAIGVNGAEEMTWKEYLKSLLIFNLIGFLALFILQISQRFLPLNPQNFPNIDWALAFNTAASFVTNTNWQAYSGETTLSYLTQMLGLTVQNFVSAATGMAALVALSRGIAHQTQKTVGNFWADMVRFLIYILIPFSIIISLFLVSQGVVQTFSPYVEATTLENKAQTIPLGPVASQIAIKQLGTNGGGFFNANSAHPFENPSPLSNFVEALLLVLIPAASFYTFGIIIGNKKQGWFLFGVVFLLWVLGMAISLWSDEINNPILGEGLVYEGKETRFGIFGSNLWSVTTTATANGSVNAMISSLSPISGGVALFNLMVGELIFGGIGVGLSSLLMFVLLTVFLSGLMVGRTPEFLGKKIEKKEMQWVSLAILAPSALILIGAGISSVLPQALASLGNKGPHGLSEILYAFSSAAANNGSAFAGLNANTNFYNLALGVVMILARLAIIVPSLALAGLLVVKKRVPISIGTLRTDDVLFFILVISVILIVGALTFFPTLCLGPVVEQLLMLKGQVF